MAHYYNSDEYVIFKSDYKRVKKLQNMRCWIECTEGPRHTNPPRTTCEIVLKFERTDDTLSELEGYKPYKAHLVVNGEDHLYEGQGYIAHEWGVESPHSLLAVYLSEYDSSANRTITVSAYIESDVYDFGRIDFTFDLPEVPPPATITVPSVIEVGTPFSVVVNPSLGFCNYDIGYRLKDDEDYHWHSISNGWESKTLYISKDFTLDVDRYGRSNFNDAFLNGAPSYPSIETKTKVTLEFSCSTFDDNYGYNNLGNTSQTVELVIPESVKPTTSSLKCAPMNPSCLYESSSSSGMSYDYDSAKAIGYVKGLCKARLFICFNWEEAYGYRTASSFKSYKVWAVNPDGTQTVIKNADFETDPETNWPVLDDITRGPSYDEGYWWSPFFEGSEFGIEVVTPTLNNVGQTTYYATVTDRRGRTSDPVSVTINVVDYNKPVIARIRAQRCGSSGYYQEDGNNIVCNYEASYPAVSGNAGTFNLKVYEGLDNTGTLVETKSLSRTGNVAKGEIILTDKPNHKDYYLELVVKDNNVTITKGTIVRSTNALLDISPQGGVAVGKLSDAYYFDSSYNTFPVFEVNMVQKNYNHILPSETGKFTLGDTSNRWQTIYTTASPVSGSDARFKENINYVSSSNKARTSGQISQEDLHSFYKSDFLLTTYNYIGQEQQEYGFVTSDMYDNSVGESLIIRNENGDFFSINSYVSSIAGALQYEINLRDEQIATLNQIILEMKQELENLKQGD